MGRGYECKIFLVHVIPLLQYVAPEGSEEAIQQAKKFAAREMQRLVEVSNCKGMVHEEILCGGGVWPLLQDFADRHSINLLVVGTHGRSAARQQLLGPVAEQVFRLSECPVLTLGARPGNSAQPTDRLQ